MANQDLEKWLCPIVNDEVPAIPKLSDLPGLWREYPPEASDPNHPAYADRMTWLVLYIVLANSKPWAREGLRKLLRALLENDEPVPPLLSGWVNDQFAQGEPTPSRGRPEESDRNFRVLTVYTWLWIHGYTREAALGHIANWMVCEPESVRSIIRKFGRILPY